MGDTDVGLSDDEHSRAPPADDPWPDAWTASASALQRQGELTVYPPFEGQEAAQVGSAFALGPTTSCSRRSASSPSAVVRGVDVVEYLQYHRGTWHGGPYDPRATRFAPICVPIATQIVHAVG